MSGSLHLRWRWSRMRKCWCPVSVQHIPVWGIGIVIRWVDKPPPPRWWDRYEAWVSDENDIHPIASGPRWWCEMQTFRHRLQFPHAVIEIHDRRDENG